MTTPASPTHPTEDGSRTGAQDPLLELDHVDVQSLRRPGTVMVQDVRWQVNAGEFWVVGGVAGAGKTDLLMLTAGLTTPGQGQVRIFGKELQVGYDPAVLQSRLQVGLVFDGGQLLNHLTIAENITLPIRYHENCRLEVCRERLEILLELTQTGPVANRFPGEINQSNRLRAALARALALQPRLLLLDCPHEGLDPHQTRWWINTLKNLSLGHPDLDGGPMTIIVASRELAIWKNTATRYALLRRKEFLVAEKELAPEEQAAKLSRDWLPPEGDAH